MSRRTRIIVLFGMLFLLQVALLTYWHLLTSESQTGTQLALTFATILLAGTIDYFSARLLLSAIDRTEAARITQAASELEKSLESYRIMAEREERLVRRISHTIEDELATARTAYAQGNSDEAAEHIHQSLDMASEAYTLQHTNVIANAVLEAKRRQCEDRGIRLVSQIDVNGRMGLSDIELATIVFNLIDYALAACEELLEQDQTADAAIMVRLLTAQSQLVAEVESSASPDSRRTQRSLKTRRRTPASREIDIVEDIAARHEGLVECADDGRLTRVSVLIPLDQPEGSKTSDLDGTNEQVALSTPAHH